MFTFCTDYKSALSGQIVKLDNKIPKEVIIENKEAKEQLRLIAELDEDDKMIVFKMIEKMLTSKKFKEFFKQKIHTL